MIVTTADFGLYKDCKLQRNVLKFRWYSAICGMSFVLIMFAVTIGAVATARNRRIPKETDTANLNRTAEQLVASQPKRFERHNDPRPFRITFGSTKSEAFYPRHRQRESYPRNIQDIIRHSPRNREIGTKSQYGEMSSEVRIGDHFRQFVPQNPAEINLMATACWQFYNPTRKDFRRPERFAREERSFTVTMNVFGMDSSALRLFKKDQNLVLNLNVAPLKAHPYS
ncbi:uncharacterized protein LOC132703865 [Cylas formicarius]|uniref:uncharacterized protein LOC132703865 n=1 Tax=Cylas formicarius TaxID=197179 RepID=UPI0029587DEA|nr:uncharacterized protein LOC132703865 [Cylas formicarius]